MADYSEGLTGVSGSSGSCETLSTKSASASSSSNILHAINQSESHQLVPPSSSTSSLNHNNNPTSGSSTITTTLSPSHQLTNESTNTSSHLLSIAGDAIHQSTVTKVAHNQQSKCINEKKRYVSSPFIPHTFTFPPNLFMKKHVD